MSAAKSNPKRALELDQLPDRMRPDQVASYLGCTSEHVLHLVKSGALDAVNMAGPKSTRSHYRIERRAVAEFEKARRAS